MEKNPLQRLAEFGQSVWLDNIRRGLITSGELKRMIDEDAVVGRVLNAAALTHTSHYHEAYDSQRIRPRRIAKCALGPGLVGRIAPAGRRGDDHSFRSCRRIRLPQGRIGRTLARSAGRTREGLKRFT